ncbi:MAG: hypothetical protein AB7V36_14090 [Bacteroidales bacterium]
MKWLFLLSALIPVLSGNAQTDSVKKKEFATEFFCKVDAASFGTSSEYYCFESGAKIQVYSFKIFDRKLSMQLCIAYKQCGFSWNDKLLNYYAGYLNYGFSFSSEFSLLGKFSLMASTELLRNSQIMTHFSSDVNINIDKSVSAIQNKTGIGFYYHMMEEMRIGLSAQIAPCFVTSAQSIGGTPLYPTYYHRLIDDGWPFYIGTSLMIKL